MATNETINKRHVFGKRQHSAMIPHAGIKPELVAGHLPPPPEHFPSDEICSTNRQWEQINSTHDFYENEVEVVHQDGMQQFIYTYRCASTRGKISLFQKQKVLIAKPFSYSFLNAILQKLAWEYRPFIIPSVPKDWAGCTCTIAKWAKNKPSGVTWLLRTTVPARYSQSSPLPRHPRRRKNDKIR